MIDWGMLIVLLVAIAVGFAMGRRSARVVDEPEAPSLERHYIQGLNYLLNERPDAAIDTFIDALDVNSETLETHLALGNLLRKRGEVGRAIKIHQNLLARPGLAKEQGRQVQLELARDFVKAGLLDRAEMLLLELVETSVHPVRTQCLEYLIEIYRDEKEWRKAIDSIAQLPSRRFSRLPDRWRLTQSHFYCELAQEALDKSDYLGARRQIKAAFVADKLSARASLLLAELEYRLGQYKEAVKSLKQIFHQDPSILPEAIPLLVTCYRATGRNVQLRDYLLELIPMGASTAVILALTDLIESQEGASSAAKFLTEHLESGSSLAAADKMLKLQISVQGGDEGLAMASKAITSIQSLAPDYRCQSCGFSGQEMHWLCPSCKSWGTVRPVE